MLVVDDDPKAVEVIAAFLPRPAYAVVRAYGGAEAIALAQRLRPDLILLDLMMPDVSGFDVVEALQRDPRHRAHPDPGRHRQADHRADRAALNSEPDSVHPHRREGRVQPGRLHRRGAARAAAAA